MLPSSMSLLSWSRNLKAACAVMALPIVLAIAMPARADIVTVQDMLRGTNSTPTQCSAVHDAVWVTVKEHSFCMRYYLAPAAAKIAVRSFSCRAIGSVC